MENTSGYIPGKKDSVLVYIGDTEFFNKKLAATLWAGNEAITRAISSATEGIIIAKGSNTFKENFDIEFNIGDKITFKGYFGQTYSRKKGVFKILNTEEPNCAYYRILKDSDIEALCINQN